MSRLIYILLILASAQIAAAQPGGREIVTQPIQWMSVATNVKLSKRTTFFLEGQFRQAGSLDPMQYQLRTGLDFEINEHLSIMPLAYVYTWNYRYGKQPAMHENDEHRIFQQAIYKHDIGRFALSHRVRFEQRFIQSHTETEEGHVVNEGYDVYLNRVRYRFLVNYPLNRPKVQANTYFLSAYDEAFVSWGSGVTFHEPDQNRLYAGVGYQFKSPLTLQAGFLYQMIIKNNGAMQENNLGVQVQVAYNFDLTKK